MKPMLYLGGKVRDPLRLSNGTTGVYKKLTFFVHHTLEQCQQSQWPHFTKFERICFHENMYCRVIKLNNLGNIKEGFSSQGGQLRCPHGKEVLRMDLRRLEIEPKK